MAALYRVKLKSGRVLGPMDLGRITLLMLKDQILGEELALKEGENEWKNINHFPELADLFLQKAQGTLEVPTGAGPSGYKPIKGKTSPAGSTLVLPDEDGNSRILPGSEAPSQSIPSIQHTNTLLKNEAQQKEDVPEGEGKPSPLEVKEPSLLPDPDQEKTVVASESDLLEVHSDLEKSEESHPTIVSELEPIRSEHIGDQATVVLQRPMKETAAEGPKPTESRFSIEKLGLNKQKLIRVVLIGAVAFALFNQLFGTGNPSRKGALPPIQPVLPSTLNQKPDPSQSTKLYRAALKYYAEDNVLGYRKAAVLYQKAASLDPDNVRAIALLASTYINLIDSSKKDATYFSVITRLIEMSRAKKVDLPETIIADVEFYITVNRGEAALNRLVEYTKVHRKFGLELYYYLAWVYYKRGDAQSAAQYLNQYPDDKVFSPKVHYLRGRVAESLGAKRDALLAYEKALKMNSRHVKSRLRISTLLDSYGKLTNAASHLNYILQNSELLPPIELAHAYALRAKLNAQYNKWDIALGDIENAVQLDKYNNEYRVEMYTLRAKAGEEIEKIRSKARMYYFLSQGEKFIGEGQYDEALNVLLQARQAEPSHALPLLKIGDLFTYKNDLANAKLNYQKASLLAPKAISVWKKYIDVLIQSYEWNEAEQAMSKFRNIPQAVSSIDRLAGDMYAKQKNWIQALTHYKNAMTRKIVDSDVYIAYAKGLVATGYFKEAPYFFALALRFDPLNMDAIIGTARCVAETEGIDRAISMLRDELQKLGGFRSDLLAAIAELQLEKGDLVGAKQSIQLAKKADPNNPTPWKIEGDLILSKPELTGEELDQAATAYQSYSDRNPSDPSGYIERYKIFVRKSQYQKADSELTKIYEIYPKYPGLHLYKGDLYSKLGNFKVAVREYQRELANHKNNVGAVIALGKAYLEVEKYEEGLKLFNQAMQMAPRTSEPVQQAAWANFKLKNYQGAVALFKTAIQYDSGNPLIYKRLGLTYRAMGDRAAAARAFRKYLQLAPDAPDRAQFKKFL